MRSQDSGPLEGRPLLEVRGLRTVYEGNGVPVLAVDRVNLAVRLGETVGVVGRSGSGKTQTFLSILGLDSGVPGVVEGEARWRNRDLLGGLEDYVDVDGARIRKDLDGWSRRRRGNLDGVPGREIGMLFQEPRSALVPYWSVGTHIEHLGGGMVNPEEVLHGLGFSDPRAVLESFPQQLSGGEAQRVMIAFATLARPSLVIADEPTTGLDAISEMRVLEALRAWASDPDASLVLISHDLAVIRLLADTIYVFHQGRVVERLDRSVLDAAAPGTLHPYTERLRASYRARALGTITRQGRSGSPTERDNKRSGCSYSGACPLRRTLAPEQRRRCDAERPQLAERMDGVASACWGLTP